MNPHLRRDADEVLADLGELSERFAGASVLVTGAAGFLGAHLIHVFARISDARPARAARVTACDSFRRGHPAWLGALAGRSDIEIVSADIAAWTPAHRFDFIIHAASIASPVFYRRHPVETIDANVIGLRRLLGHAEAKGVASVLFFSSSEIYGDPPPHAIPTREDFPGNVSCTGPRACYDESKRLGETLCVAFARARGVPTRIVRPFNNYGPGLAIDDRRVLADFCRDALAGRDIELLSDGSPTRTFCYASDAVAGYLRALLLGRDGEPYNIGAERPEISMRDLAATVLAVARSGGRVRKGESDDKDYLTDNPQRRCPDISKARAELGYQPKIALADGIGRMLAFYRDEIKLAVSA
jgi:UDP-glucuronate decarboxylase